MCINKLDAVRGCMIGGAAGDALGYAVEFIDARSIFERYGEEGITEYSLAYGKALISDDTQMTLFTANGMLVHSTMSRLYKDTSLPRKQVGRAYLDWYSTQIDKGRRDDSVSWLCDVAGLYCRRAPGNTCMSALRSASVSGISTDGIKYPVNNSKGCGGVMRAAPVALAFDGDIREADIEAAQTAAITHGHSLGYLPAAVLCHIIRRAVFCREGMSLKEIVEEARDTVVEIFPENGFAHNLARQIDLAISLTENDCADLKNIKKLGEGWTGDEALVIAIYCSIKYGSDFSKGIIAAVNHDGDSDSTGAITGNILGAWLGYSAIEDKWKEDLELSEVILEIADDLARVCPAEFDGDWHRKYVENKWK